MCKFWMSVTKNEVWMLRCTHFGNLIPFNLFYFFYIYKSVLHVFDTKNYKNLTTKDLSTLDTRQKNTGWMGIVQLACHTSSYSWCTAWLIMRNIKQMGIPSSRSLIFKHDNCT